MWEIEELSMALEYFNQWSLTPQERELNQSRGWTEVCRVLGAGQAQRIPSVKDAATHPWWLELEAEQSEEPESTSDP